MTERQQVTWSLGKAREALNNAEACLEVEGLDIMRAVVFLAQAENRLAEARERLAQVSRAALSQALDENKPYQPGSR